MLFVSLSYEENDVSRDLLFSPIVLVYYTEKEQWLPFDYLLSFKTGSSEMELSTVNRIEVEWDLWILLWEWWVIDMSLCLSLVTTSNCFLAFSHPFPIHHRLRFSLKTPKLHSAVLSCWYAIAGAKHYTETARVFLVTGSTESAVLPKSTSVSFLKRRTCPQLNPVVLSLV